MLITLSPLLFLVSCDLTEQHFFEKQELQYAEEQSEDVIIYEITGEHIEREIRAARVERFYDDKRIEAYTVEITDYHPDKTLKMRLETERLTIDEIRNTYTATGNVIIEQDDTTLYTGHMTWNQNSDEIYAPNEVLIVRGNNVLRGFELSSDIEFSRIELSRVTAEGEIDDEEFSDIDW